MDEVLKPYKATLDEAYGDITLDGKNIIVANTQHPSVIAYYDEQRVEMKHMVGYAELMVKRLKGTLYNDIKKSSPKALSVTEMDKMIESSPAYIEIYCKFLDIKELYDKFVSITNALLQKSYTLTNLVKIYENDLQNITIHINEE